MMAYELSIAADAASEARILKLLKIAPDNVERAIDEAIRHAATTLHGTFSGYLDWCIERGMVDAPMPWLDPHWELRRKIEMIAGGECKAQFRINSMRTGKLKKFRDFQIVMDRWGTGMQSAFIRFAPELARSRRLREQSWKRRKTGRAVK